MGWFDHLEHSFNKEVHNVEHAVSKDFHKAKHGIRHTAHTLEHVGNKVEHGVTHTMGVAEGTIVSEIKKGGKLAGQAEHWMAKTGHEAFALTEEGAKDAWDYTKQGAKTIGDFFNPLNWSMTEWILIGGGGIVLVYFLFKGGQTAVRYAPAVAETAGRAAETAAPLLLL